MKIEIELDPLQSVKETKRQMARTMADNFDDFLEQNGKEVMLPTERASMRRWLEVSCDQKLTLRLHKSLIDLEEFLDWER